VWNRFFAMYVGSSIYSYAMVLALYLCGIVAGGLVCERLVAAGRDPERLAAGAFVAVVAALAVTVPVMDRVLIPQLVLLDALGLGFATFQVASAAAVALVVLPPTLAFGVSFPAVAAAIARQPRHAGRATGLVYLVNSAGTTAGSVVVSFLLMPALGVRGGLAALTAAMAAAALLAARGVRRPAALAAVIVALAAVPAVTPAWDLRRMHMAVNNDAAMVLNAWRNGLLQLALDGVEVLDLRDGVDATVSVARYADGEHALLVNGKGDASDGIDMFTQLVLGHLPLAVWPEARDVLVVGMGSGVTVGAVLRHPVARVDLVEISPEVIELGGRYFRGVNRAALDDPRVTVHVEDGRNFIAFGTGQYDLVVSEPSNPWMTGVANLFTGEFFGQVRARLRPGGALVQWFHQYGMALDDVRALLATLRRHFAHVYVFAFHHDLDIAGDLVMLATDAPLDFSRALAAFGGGPVAEDLRRFGAGEPAALAHGFALGPGTLERFVDGAALNTDDRPRIELNAPRNVLRDTAADNFEAVLAASHGAVLPATDAGGLVPRLARGPAGLREVSAGVRIVVSDGRAPTGFRARLLASDARWEDGAGADLRVVGVGGVRDARKLTDLVSRLLAAPVTPAGAATVGGHRALRFGAPSGETLVGWTCERRGASFVAVGPGAATADVACHE
jgi:spermidine synthase